MDQRRHDYYLSVAESLAECQLVEFELKYYIANALELSAKNLMAILPFRMTAVELQGARKNYPRATLGRLTKYFARLSDNPALVISLREFSKERNYLAHAALATCIDPEGGPDHHMMEELSGRVTATKVEARRLVEEIHETSLKWIAHLYFDNLDEPVTPGASTPE